MDHIENSFSVVAPVISMGTCLSAKASPSNCCVYLLKICCLAANVVFLSVLRSLHSNSSTCYNTFSTAEVISINWNAGYKWWIWKSVEVTILFLKRLGRTMKLLSQRAKALGQKLRISLIQNSASESSWAIIHVVVGLISNDLKTLNPEMLDTNSILIQLVTQEVSMHTVSVKAASSIDNSAVVFGLSQPLFWQLVVLLE
jgi:hypothetical protein